MKKKTLALVLTLCMTVTALASFAAGAAAAGGLQAVTAYLNSGITIKLDGEEKVLTDANGVRTYPISYNNTTYLPIRAIANLLGIEVDWDQATASVLLGDTTDRVDLIDTYTAYASNWATQRKTSDKKTTSIGGVEADHWIEMYSWSKKDIHFNLGGKYTSLTFQVYSTRDTTLTVYGDEGTVLAEIPVTGSAVPKTVTVPLFNTTELYFFIPILDPGTFSAYIFDAKLS